jgi:carboxymethylenebutenolidase
MPAKQARSSPDAGVNHVVETYAGARHGLAVRDLSVFSKEAAERHWKSLLTLFQDCRRTK